MDLYTVHIRFSDERESIVCQFVSEMPEPQTKSAIEFYFNNVENPNLEGFLWFFKKFVGGCWEVENQSSITINL